MCLLVASFSQGQVLLLLVERLTMARGILHQCCCKDDVCATHVPHVPALRIRCSRGLLFGYALCPVFIVMYLIVLLPVLWLSLCI
jgi:hypothetical protein